MYSYIDDHPDVSGRFMPHVFSAGGTMAKETSRLFAAILERPQYIHPPGERTNPHRKATMNRFLFRRYTMAFALTVRSFFGDGLPRPPIQL